MGLRLGIFLFYFGPFSAFLLKFKKKINKFILKNIGKYNKKREKFQENKSEIWKRRSVLDVCPCACQHYIHLLIDDS